MEGQTTNPAPAETPIVQPATPAPVVPVPPAPAADTQGNLILTLSQRLGEAERRNAELEAADRERRIAAERAEQDRLAAQGNADAARQALEASRAESERQLNAERAQRADIERRSRTAFRDRELATALSGRDLLPGAAQQLQQLFRDQLEAHAEGEGYAVRTRDFVAVDAFVARELARPEYAHFQKPATTGGANPDATNKTDPRPAEAAKTPEERLNASLRAAVQRQRTGAPGLDGSYGVSAGVN